MWLLLLVLLIAGPVSVYAQPVDIAVDYPIGETELEVKSPPETKDNRIIFALDRSQWGSPQIKVLVQMFLSLDGGRNYDALGYDKEGNPIPFCAFTSRGGFEGLGLDMTIVSCPLPGKESPDRMHKILMTVTGGTLTTIADQATFEKQ